MTSKEQAARERAKRIRAAVDDSVYDIYKMHESSFITGKVKHRVMANNAKYLNLGQNMP